jgi:hypothetical protein
MVLIARVLRSSGPTQGSPLCSSPLSPGDLVPMVPNLISTHQPSTQDCLPMIQRVDKRVVRTSIWLAQEGKL